MSCWLKDGRICIGRMVLDSSFTEDLVELRATVMMIQSLGRLGGKGDH